MKKYFYRILALDLSKANTGLSVAYLDEEFSNIKLQTFSIYPDARAKYATAKARDCQFIEINQIKNKVEEHLKKDLSKLKTFVVIENPIYHSFSTELTYYLFQSILEIAYNNSVDVIGIVPMTLKKFIGFQYRDQFNENPPKKGHALDKKEIKHVFNQLKKTKYFDKYKEYDDPKNDDEMDSFFLVDFAINCFNDQYFKIWNSTEITLDQYKKLTYSPKKESSFTILYSKEEFFTLKDRKFYPLRLFKELNSFKQK